jgi:hypothetical protein
LDRHFYTLGALLRGGTRYTGTHDMEPS